MLDADSLLVQRFGHQRPGLDLTAIEDAALPVTVVGVDVLAQERKGLPLLDEFVLRLADVGLTSTDELASFLGLDRPVVESNVADQIISNNLSHAGSRPTVALTSQGKRVVQDLEAVKPVQCQLPIVFDRLTWSATDYPRSELVTKQVARESGMVLLPAARSSRISQEDITAPAINGLFSRRGSDKQQLEVLTVRKVHPNTHRFLPVKLLIYGDSERGEVQLAVSVDGDLSQPHELALGKLGGAESMGIQVSAPPERPLLAEDLEAVRIPSDEVARLRSATISSRIEAARADAASLVQLTPTSGAEQALAEIPVRSVSVFEHRELLNEALDSARVRILLISPWIKSAVVDTEFIARLERRLQKGVRVHIAHGFGHDDRGSDDQALQRLANLRRRYSERFVLTRLANTHAKILIADDKWVSTSFNWLSFRGDPERTYRMEEGTLVQIRSQVNAEYERYVSLIGEQRIDQSQ
jgi:hypothetical protein